MKTALCFAGTGRSIDYTFSHLKEVVIEPLGDDCDVIVYITDNPDAEKTGKLFNSVSSNVEIVTEETIDPAPYRFEPNWPPAWGVRDLAKGREVFLKMVKSRRYLVEMLKKTGKKYDRVIFSRMDVLYEVPMNESIDHLPLDDLWVPDVHNWCGGYNDRFAVSNQEKMIKYFSQWDYMPQYASDGFIFQAERSLKYHLSNMGITPKHFRCDLIRIRNGSSHESFEKIRGQAVVPCDI